MKYSILFLSIAISLLFVSLTGFQCGSSEMTSAKLYMTQHNYDRADTALMKEVTKNPTNSEAWYLLGRIKLEQGNFPLMTEYFDKSLGAGKEFEKDISDAKKYAWVTTLNKGAALINRAATLRKESPDAKKDSIQSYLTMAVEAYQVALKVNPDSSITYQNLAIAQLSTGNYDDEVATLKEAKKRSNDPSLDTMMIDGFRAKLEFLNSQILASEQKKNKEETAANYEKAIACVNEARQLYPSNGDLMAIQTDFYVRSGKAKEAIPALREAIQQYPGNKLNHYNLGSLLLQTDDLKGAITEFDAALAIDPDYDIALQFGAVAYMKLGDKVRKSNNEGGIKKEVDKSYIEDFKKAVAYLEKLEPVKKDDANYWDALATAYANAGLLKKANEAIKKADALHKK